MTRRLALEVMWPGHAHSRILRAQLARELGDLRLAQR
jgi:hypothetical protein